MPAAHRGSNALWSGCLRGPSTPAPSDLGRGDHARSEGVAKIVKPQPPQPGAGEHGFVAAAQCRAIQVSAGLPQKPKSSSPVQCCRRPSWARTAATSGAIGMARTFLDLRRSARARLQGFSKPTGRLELPTPSLRVAYSQDNCSTYGRFTAADCRQSQVRIAEFGTRSGTRSRHREANAKSHHGPAVALDGHDRKRAAAQARLSALRE